MGDEHHRHEGEFAEGQQKLEHHPEREERGDFAEGQEREDHEHEGTFATGQEKRKHHAEQHGDFARSDEHDEYGRD